MDDAYQADKNEVREVHYAGKDALIVEIEKREGYVAPSMARRALERRCISIHDN